ncbi:homoserine kinase [Patulibacter minatonensis]|uniref:homoserine kinase n=1 Tax=Patulibacter minatonensis TaxID=298163 RepID=UPI00047C2D5B|nr:homoserine kinase [Patulibacter minatonensis]
MGRTVSVSVPASSANLGPGFDCMAAALGLWLHVEVEETGTFAVEHDLPLSTGRDNVIVQAFERLRSADGVTFRVRTEIPLAGGLGSSATAIVAGLAAAAALDGGSTEPDALLPLAVDVEGHPDNVSAALYGGIVLTDGGWCVRIAPPEGLEAVFVVPHEAVRTAAARAVLPQHVPLEDATKNVAWGAALAIGLERGDLDIVAHSLQDVLHQPHRAALFPRSSELIDDATSLGAIGATVSGAGPTVMLWTSSADAPAVLEQARERAAGWATVLHAPFVGEGARVAVVVGD